MPSRARRWVARMLPGLRDEAVRLHVAEDGVHRLEQSVARLEDRVTAIQGKVEFHDDRLDLLRRLAARVEHYQPLYGVVGIIEAPARESASRAAVIEAAMVPVRGQRVLDIGASLGYMSLHLAARGARVTGWDMNADNVAVARALAEINGLPVTFQVQALDLETSRAVAPGQFDSALILAVLHHVVHFQGLDAAQRIVAELFERVPVLYLELALKGEDPDLFWDAAQPEDPLAVLDLVRDQGELTHLMDVSTHLSSVRRPLYRFARRTTVEVGSHTYPYDDIRYEAFDWVPHAREVAPRRFFIGQDHVVKEYLFTPDFPDNWAQIVNELWAHSRIAGHQVHHQLRLVDHAIDHERARLVLERVPGQLLDELAPLPAAHLVTVARDVLLTLRDLQGIGLAHNDVRSWNIMVNDDGGWLIDYGLVGPPVEDDVVALTWALAAGARGTREPYEPNKLAPPSPDSMRDPRLADLLARIEAGERDLGVLLSTLEGPA